MKLFSSSARFMEPAGIWHGAGRWARHASVAVLLGIIHVPVSGATWRDDFSSDPLSQGWEVLGDAPLFNWSPSDAWVNVTWDSSKSNSYFYKQLGTILTRGDDFAFAFDLVMDDIRVGVDPGKPYTFQLALALINRRDATAPDFFRGSGINAQYGARNLVEFSYFPDSGFGETFAPTVVSTNNRIVFSDNHPLVLTAGDHFRIRLEYSARESVLRTVATRNGQPFGLPPDQSIRELPVPASLDFRVDGVAICNYNDSHQFPEMFAGSLLAHGRVDNIEVTVPEPPIQALRGRFQDASWRVAFEGRTNWLYHLERSSALREWRVTDTRAGWEGTIILVDEDAPPRGNAFYRVRAER